MDTTLFTPRGLARRVKAAWAVALLIALAGCTAPEEPAEPDLWQPCPQWLPGDAQVLNATVDGDARIVLDGFAAERDGRALDLFVLTFTVNGSVSLKAELDGARLLLDRDGDADLPNAELQDGDVFRVFLSPVIHGSDAASGDLALVLGGQGSIEVTAEPYYRVCGVPST